MAATMGPKEAQLAEVWRANRPYLVDLAFGMLGDVGAAEDAVQEAFARLTDSRFDEIEDKRGWLIVVTSRICLDQIHSARSRRERTLETSAIDLVGASAPASMPPMDPADRVTLDDEVGLALLVVLQKLSPAERVAFVLHDVFQLPFETIAHSLGRSAPTCRQLARRARMKIRSQGTEERTEVSISEQRQVAEEFIQACSNGDMSALLQLLDPGVWGDVDLGPYDPRNGQGAKGPHGVAHNLLRYFGSSTTLVSNPIGGHPVVLSFNRDKLWAVIQLTIVNNLVKKIHVIADPVKIAFLSAQLDPAGVVGGTTAR
ncbi:MAG TPA: RNA polymerase sigma factor SigI [Acidimicrobiales bacterium]|nr:RNA polymerase sigma factor SigI [Acidimicrobiales bacterium]